MINLAQNCLPLLTATILIVGCSGGNVDQPEANASASVNENSGTELEAPKEKPPQETKSQQESEDAKPEESTEVAFEPPFPDRLDIFSAPKRQGKVLAKTKGQEESAVELLGFSNVGEPQALLAVNGIVAPLAEGEQYFGIEVISIQPPKVVLQRGRQRWQATIEYN